LQKKTQCSSNSYKPGFVEVVIYLVPPWRDRAVSMSACKKTQVCSYMPVSPCSSERVCPRTASQGLALRKQTLSSVARSVPT